MPCRSSVCHRTDATRHAVAWKRSPDFSRPPGSRHRLSDAAMARHRFGWLRCSPRVACRVASASMPQLRKRSAKVSRQRCKSALRGFTLAEGRVRPHAQVHMRIGLEVVQHHHVAVAGEFRLGELACGALHSQWVGASRHRQHDVEGFAPIAALGDARATVTPLICHVLHRLFALALQASVVLHWQPASLADVAEVRSDGHHAPSTPGDFDHDLRGAAYGDGLDALTDGCSAFPQRAAEAWPNLSGGYASVAVVEQLVAALDQHTIDCSRVVHGSSPT